MLTIGIDIGTTTVCAAISDESKNTLRTVSRPNLSCIPSNDPDIKIQDPDIIFNTVKEIFDESLSDFPDIKYIGITGQMHGILYTDRFGKACSPLYTWQDQRGNKPFDDTHTYVEKIYSLCEEKIPTGFGVCTCFYNSINNEMPKNACKICTISDYIAMRMSGNDAPVLHPSLAESIGLFSPTEKTWDIGSFKKLGIDTDILPEISDSISVIGENTQRCKILIPIGDNQASFLGACDDTENSVLINIGTGSQVSFLVSEPVYFPNTDLRSFINGKFLVAGSALCGGKSFSILEKFFRDTVLLITGKKIDDAYKAMDKYLESCGNELKAELNVSTLFNGSRSEPLKRGSVNNISTENFTPQNMILGFLHGMVNELYDFYKPLKAYKETDSLKLIGAGNGLRMNPALCSICSDVFNMPFSLSGHSEEAAFGASQLYRYI